MGQKFFWFIFFLYICHNKNKQYGAFKINSEIRSNTRKD